MKQKNITYFNLKTLPILLFVFFFPTTVNSKVDSLSIANAAMDRTKYHITYDPSYFKISYPMGDVPARKGVCTDVVIRSYRALGIDLQELVHEDIKNNFEQYPKMWELKAPNTNIDHRRVPNLQVFFKKYGKELPITDNPNDYKPGDIVVWNIASRHFIINSIKRIFRNPGRKGLINHIGIVSNKKVSGKNRYKVVHNIAWGPKCEDSLFDYPIIGHYRYLG